MEQTKKAKNPGEDCRFHCGKCGKSYAHYPSLRNHTRLTHSGATHKCEHCWKRFLHSTELHRHVTRAHNNTSHMCKDCPNSFQKKLDLKAHEEQAHPNTYQVQRYEEHQPHSSTLSYYKLHDGIDGAIQVFRISPVNHVFRDVLSYAAASKPTVKYLVKTTINLERSVKWHLRLTCEFVRTKEVEEHISIAFTSSVKIGVLRDGEGINTNLDEIFSYFLHSVEEFEDVGSGWELEQCGSMCDVYMARYIPIRASSYLVLPKWLRKRRSIINIKNKDSQNCFILSVLADIYPQKTNRQRPQKYEQYQNMMECTNLTYPVSFDQISLFEKLNQISVNVYGIDGKEIVVLRQSKLEVYAKSVNLLLVESKTKQHYCLIANLDMFMSSFGSNHVFYFCRKCLLCFKTNFNRRKHELVCSSKHQVVELPTNETKFIKFRNVSKMHRVPLIFVADIETLIRPIQGSAPDVSHSFTMPTAHHDVMLVSARGVFQCCDISTREYIDLPIVEGLNAVTDIVEQIIACGVAHQNRINAKKTIVMNRSDWSKFHKTNACEICHADFESNKSRVRDHCHFCSRYRLALCKECNFDYFVKRDIHAYTHNFSGFDSTYIVPALGKIAKSNSYKLECIAKGADKFITVSMRIPFKDWKGRTRSWCLKFFDTLQFLDGKLAVLVDALRRDGKDRFHATRNVFGDSMDLFIKKQQFPYTYVSDETRLNETCLPPPSAFFNDLSEEPISDEDYAHAVMVWDKMKCVTLRDYYKLYLACDVNLLIDVWENFRAFTLQHYKLDAACYLTGSGLTYDAMLYYTGVKLELITDIEMYDMVNRGIRGGLSFVSNRFEFANEADYPNYDSEKPHNVLFFVDAVNLYGWSMQQTLAVGSYRWLSHHEICEFDVMQFSFNNSLGFLIECDLQYPDNIHDSHNSNPLAPELMSIGDEILSETQRAHKRLLKCPIRGVPKLVNHLGPRRNYILDYRNLQLYLELGMKLEKIHRVLCYEQKSWMAPYILFNTSMRRNASSDFQKSLFKRMNNACFGKQLEDSTKYRKTMLCTDSKKAERLIRQSNYCDSTIYGSDLVCIHLKPLKVKLTKMRIAGCQITELAKHRMQSYYFQCLLKSFGDNLRLILHDTDSILASVKNEPKFYDKLGKMLEWHDFSTVPRDHCLYDTSNKGKPGFMALECGGRRIEAVTAVRAKCYAIQFAGGNEKKTLKGVSKVVRDKKLRFSDYLQCLSDNSTGRKDSMKMLRKVDGQMYTLLTNKSSLVNYDDKRHIISLSETYAHGHYKIRNS